MSDRVNTLVLYANGAPHPRLIAEDTVLRGVLGLREADQLSARAPWKRALARKLWQRFETLSYMQDWQDAFCTTPELDVETCNILNLVELARARRKIRDYPLIVILHSAAGDDMSLLQRMSGWLQDRRGTLLVLLGNEYQLMPEKIGFLRAVAADFIGSQLPDDAAAWLYGECESSRVLSAPHALNQRIYRPGPLSGRPIDLGFIGSFYPYFVGDVERTRLIEHLAAAGPALGLQCDVRTQRMEREEWARYLNDCNGVGGAESGTYYLERTDQTKYAVQDYLQAHPGATFDEVFDRFFRDYPNPISGKAISSRHFEPIGTQTCQVLLEGRYNDILVAGEHYIAVKKDLSNLPDAVEQFKDECYRTAMVQRTYDYVLSAHTYQHRVRSLVGTCFPGLFATS